MRPTPTTLAVLARFGDCGAWPAAVSRTWRLPAARPAAPTCRVENLVIGNNALAVDAAGAEAERLGYSHAMQSAPGPEAAAEDVGRHLARLGLGHAGRSRPGLLDQRRGAGGYAGAPSAAAKGAAISSWFWPRPKCCSPKAALAGSRLVSGGTDGEDGPTDAAGAVVDGEVLARAAAAGVEGGDFLARNDAYHYFSATGGLLQTGPTDTNVCDVRVVAVERIELAASASVLSCKFVATQDTTVKHASGLAATTTGVLYAAFPLQELLTQHTSEPARSGGSDSQVAQRVDEAADGHGQRGVGGFEADGRFAKPALPAIRTSGRGASGRPARARRRRSWFPAGAE